MAARIDRNRSLPIPYRPAPPPGPASTVEEIMRATWDEFTRIAASFSDVDRPLSFSAHGTDTISVGNPGTYTVMLDVSPVVDWEQPGGSFNPANGVWTCQTEGLYQVFASVVSQPFPAPATKSYGVLGQILLTRAVGGTVTYPFSGGGLDDQLVTAVTDLLLPLAQGDTLRMSAAGTHPTKTGTNSVTATLNIVRQSGTGNAD